MGLSGFFTPLYRESIFVSAGYHARDIRRFDVPSTQVKFDHGDESFDRIVNR